MPQLTDDQIKNYEIRQSLRILNSNVAGKTIDYNDVGYDLVIAWGASNVIGFGTPIDPAENVSSPRILQYASSGTRANTIYTASEPLAHREIRPNNPGNVFTFSRLLAELLPATRRVLILPVALSGQSFANNRWNPGNDLFTDTVSRANTILSQSRNHRVLAFVSAVSSPDIVNVTDAAFVQQYVNFYSAIRSQITRAADAVALTVGYADASLTLDGGARQRGENLLQNTLPNVIPNLVPVSAAGLAAEADNIHFTGASQVALGMRMYERYLQWLRGKENARVF